MLGALSLRHYDETGPKVIIFSNEISSAAVEQPALFQIKCYKSGTDSELFCL